LGMQSCKTVLGANYTKTLLATDFARAFQMLWDETGSLVSQVLPPHSTKSRDFFFFLMHMEEFILQMRY